MTKKETRKTSQIIYRKLSDLQKLPNNPRIIKDDDFKRLCKSVSDNPDYFEARPIILSDRTGELVIIAGNQRYEAAKFLKFKEVPTFLLSNLTEKKEKEIIIRDNVNNGDWSYEVLANEWSQSDLEEWGLDLPEWKDEEKKEDKKDLSDNLKSRHILEIECESEAEQEILYNRFLGEGLKCKILSL